MLHSSAPLPHVSCVYKMYEDYKSIIPTKYTWRSHTINVKIQFQEFETQGIKVCVLKSWQQYILLCQEGFWQDKRRMEKTGRENSLSCVHL